MKSLIQVIFIFCALLGASGAAHAQPGAICGNPAIKECVGQYDDFKPYDLIFNTGRARLGTGTRHESVEFYVVMLESVRAAKTNGEGCNFVGETKRLAAQKLFPKNKVFASRHNCRDNVLGYENTDQEFNFMAIYAGETEAQAKTILTQAKGKYRSASIRKIKAVLDFADE